MPKKRDDNLNLVLLIVTIVLIGLALVFIIPSKFGDKFTGYVVNAVSEKEKCSVEFEGTRLDLGGSFSKKSSITRVECQDIFNLRKDLILKQVCINSKNLGDVTVTWKSRNLTSIPIECPESLTKENPEVPITLEGEFIVGISDDFEGKTSEVFEQVFDKKENKIYNLKVKGKKGTQFENLSPGDTVKVRGKKTKFGEITLEGKDERSYRKVR